MAEHKKFQLSDLTDEEVDKYVEESIGGTEEYQTFEKNNDLYIRINNMCRRMDSAKEELSEVKYSISKQEYKQAGYIALQTLKKIKNVSNSASKLVSELGMEEHNGIYTESDIQISGRCEDDILHIVLPELLPDRVSDNQKGRYEEINRRYIPAFREFFINGRFRIYDKKAVICFINYYDKEQNLHDHDNFEVKQIIDILAAFLLPDDNPKWCAHFMDYRMGTDCHTEIYIVPYSKFHDFIKGEKENQGE